LSPAIVHRLCFEVLKQLALERYRERLWFV
jgi:hypothetical protein